MRKNVIDYSGDEDEDDEDDGEKQNKVVFFGVLLFTSVSVRSVDVCGIYRSTSVTSELFHIRLSWCVMTSAVSQSHEQRTQRQDPVQVRPRTVWGKMLPPSGRTGNCSSNCCWQGGVCAWMRTFVVISSSCLVILFWKSKNEIKDVVGCLPTLLRCAAVTSPQARATLFTSGPLQQEAPPTLRVCCVEQLLTVALCWLDSGTTDQ